MSQKISLLFKIVVGLVVIATVAVAAYTVITKYKKAPAEATPKYTSREPIVTDFGTAGSPDFPKDIPVEMGAPITTSYNQDHLKYFAITETFNSTKTTKENYELYKDFLTKGGWKILNKGETKELSNLYGTKENIDLNIVITPSMATSTKSQVSVSWMSRK